MTPEVFRQQWRDYNFRIVIILITRESVASMRYPFNHPVFNHLEIASVKALIALVAHSTKLCERQN